MDTFRQLQAIRDARVPVTIRTSHGVFPDMVLTNLSVDTCTFTAAFRQLRTTGDR